MSDSQLNKHPRNNRAEVLPNQVADEIVRAGYPISDASGKSAVQPATTALQGQVDKNVEGTDKKQHFFGKTEASDPLPGTIVIFDSLTSKSDTTLVAEIAKQALVAAVAADDGKTNYMNKVEQTSALLDECKANLEQYRQIVDPEKFANSTREILRSVCDMQLQATDIPDQTNPNEREEYRQQSAISDKCFSFSLWLSGREKKHARLEK